MVNKPFRSVWWCEFASLPAALAESGCVVGVADNTPDLDCRNLSPGRFTPRVLLPHDENKVVDRAYMMALLHMADAFCNSGWLPMTVFCLAGQHRSPAACAVIQSYLFGAPIESSIASVTQLWPDFVRHRHGVYASSLIRLFNEQFDGGP